MPDPRFILNNFPQYVPSQKQDNTKVVPSKEKQLLVSRKYSVNDTKFDINHISDSEFVNKYNITKHEYKYKTDKNYKAQIDEQTANYKPTGDVLDYPSGDIRKKDQTPYNSQWIGGNLIGEAQAEQAKNNNDLIASFLPMPGLGSSYSIKNGTELIPKITESFKTILNKNALESIGNVNSISNKLKYISNIEKFKPNINAYYRGIGIDGLKDAIEYNGLRVNQNPKWNDALTGNPVNISISSPYFYKGNNFKEILKYDSNVIAEVTNQNMKSRGLSNFMNLLSDKHIPNIYQPVEEIGRLGKGLFSTSIVKKMQSIPLSNDVKFYKKDWLTGYKEINIKKPLSNYTIK